MQISKRDPALKPTQTMGGTIRTSGTSVTVRREEADTTTVDVPEGHAVTVRLKRAEEMTAVSLENTSGGWILTVQGYGAWLAHVETAHGVSVDYGAQNNAVVLDVQLGEVWDIQAARDHDSMPVGLIQDAAERRYNAYTRQSGGKNYLGEPCPTWDDLPRSTQLNWIAVVDSEHRELPGYQAPHPDVLPAV